MRGCAGTPRALSAQATSPTEKVAAAVATAAVAPRLMVFLRRASALSHVATDASMEEADNVAEVREHPQTLVRTGDLARRARGVQQLAR